MTTRPLTALLALTLLLAACGGDDPAAPPAGGPTPLPPDPDGMLLPGEPGDPALPTVTLLPSPAAPEDVADGWLRSRLLAVVAPGATVGEVNAALGDHGAAIVAMLEGAPLVTLVVPAAADLAEAQARADALAATAGFSAAWPGLVPRIVPTVAPVEAPVGPRAAVGADPRDKHPPHADALDYAGHAVFSRLASMWALRAACQAPARLIIPTIFPAGAMTAEIPNFRLLEQGGEAVPVSQPELREAAARGPVLAAVAGANWTYGLGQEHTGIDPNDDLLQLDGLACYGLTLPDLMIRLADLQPAGRTVVLSTLTYGDPTFTVHRPILRLQEALQWRRALLYYGSGTGFVHVVAAGEPNSEGPALWNSPFALATAAGLRDLATLYATPAEAAAFQASYDAAVAFDPAVATPHDNVLIVGSSGPFGAESSFSASPADVRMLGQGVQAPCVLPDLCGEIFDVTGFGTDLAAAQVAGLATYLWHLAPGLSAQDVLLRIQHAYTTSATPGLVDGWIAALSADTGVSRTAGKARLALLDVNADGQFDEQDLASFLDAFAQLGGNDFHFTRWDLNADGWTGGDRRARMDLDANTLPSFTTITQQHGATTATYDENALTDLEVLCYYAWSPLYTGSTGARSSLLADCGGGPAGTILFRGGERQIVAAATVGVYSTPRLNPLIVAGAGTVTETVTADSTWTIAGGNYSGEGHAQTNHHTVTTFAEDGTFLGISGEGSGVASFTHFEAGKADNWMADGVSSTTITITFEILGQAVDYTLDFTYETTEPGPYAAVGAAARIVADKSGLALPAPLPGPDGHKAAGQLGPGVYVLEVTFDLHAGTAVQIPSCCGTTTGSVSGNWQLAFTLTP